MAQAPSHELQIFDILKRRGLLSTILAKSLQVFMERWDVDAYRAVVETHCVEESRLVEIFAEEFHLNRISRLSSYTIDRKVLESISYQDAMRHGILPYLIDEDGLHVAISNPTGRAGFEALNTTSLKMNFALVERSEIEMAIQRCYPLEMQLPQTMQQFMETDTKGEGMTP